MEELTILKILIAAVIGFSSKITWDWLKSGRVNKSEYISQALHKELCYLPTLIPDVNTLKTQTAAHEKRLDESRAEFKELRKDISGINQSLASIESTLKSFASRGA